MTKLKNTKKGMAKKALSISLVAAMLATSNVPVWAAEFSDGEAAAFTSEVEAPVVEEEAPVVEEAVPAEKELKAGENINSDSRLVNASASQHGWASFTTTSGTILDNTLTAPLDHVYYQWVYAYNGGWRDVSQVKTLKKAKKELNLANVENIIPGTELLGKELYLHVFLQDAAVEGDNIDEFIPAGTVAKENLNNYNSDKGLIFNLEGNNGNWDDATSSYVYQYSQKERKPKVTDIQLTFENGTTLRPADFEISWTHSKGNFMDADSECEVVATPSNKDLYTGILTQKYRITERRYKAGDIKAEVNKSFEYTGNVIVPGKGDITLTETVRENVLNSETAIDRIWDDQTGACGVGEHTIGVSLLNVPNYIQSSLPKYQKGTGDDAQLLSTFNITKRDLATCTAEIDPIALLGKDLATLLGNEEFVNEHVHIYGADGEELNLKLNQDYQFVLPTVTPGENGTYKVSIKAKGNNTKNFIETTLTIVTFDFDRCYFTADNGTEFKPTKAEAYTGENITKDLSGLKFGYWNYNADGTGEFVPLTKGQEYTVKVEGVNAGKNKGRVVIEGIGESYKGAKKVYTFDITPAKVVNTAAHDDVTAAAKVVFDRGNNKASDYAPAVTVKAHNTANPAKEFTLTEGKDYAVEYKYDTRNEIGATITTTVTITNPNFQGDGTLGDKVFTEKTLIARKQLSDCTIEVKDTYTYTGAAIIPEVIVKDGNEVLTKGVDYTVSASNNINVGKEAVVTVKGTGDYNMKPEDGIYDKDSTLSTKFEITPADAKDVEIFFTGGNTGVEYTGKNIKPTIVAVKLKGNDVTQQFDISYPQTNINVGKGMVTLTPIKGNQNFINTKDAVFDILARELTGTLTIYDKDGHKYTTNKNGFLEDYSGEVVSFDYDGTGHTFADAEFTPNGDYAGYVTKDDYEIKYVDNVYGGTAYIYVEGKGNFAGKGQPIKDAENGVINSVVAGTASKFNIETYNFKEQHVVIGNAEYAEGQTAKPEVTVTVLGQKLVEGKDYVLTYGNRGELTNGKTEKVVVRGIKAFGGEVEGYYAVVKRDMAHTDITVKEKSNGTYDVVVKNTGVVVSPSHYTVAYGEDSVTVTANKESKYYTGSQTVELEKVEIVKPDAPVITDVNVVGNKATVSLSKSDDGATGYDYVISKDRDCIYNKNYSDVNKNVLTKDTTFTYTQTGVYYAYCHSWVRDENGKKLFSDWSNAYTFAVESITPDTPKITSVTVKGSTVTVKYTQAANATGYDVVLGSAVKKVNGEKRPVEYGTLVSKVTKGNVVTATFKNVKKGTYYAGLHAYNRTSADGKKVFSPWSFAKTVKVK